MRRADLEHIIRASAAITGEREFVVVGSASLLASVPDPRSPALSRTRDADLYPVRAPEKAELIDGTIGELSAFDEAYRYYAQGVGPDTSVLPDGWEGRLVKLQNANTDGAIAYCLEPHDLAAAKLVAHREKDLDFVQALLAEEIVSPATLSERLTTLPIPAERQRQLREWVASAPRDPRRTPGSEGPDGASHLS